MLDARQAETIAFMTDGGIIHYECLSEDWNAEAVNAMRESGVDRMFYEFLEQAGITPLSRYSIHEDEGERAYDVEQHGADYSDELAELQQRADALVNATVRFDEGSETYVTLHDMRLELEAEAEELVDDLSKVICDQCGNPIE